MPETKLLPCNLEAEEAVIGCLLFDPNAIFEIANDLSCEAFFSTTYRTIYECALELNKNHQTVDFLSITERLKDLGILDKVGGMTALSKMMNKTISASNLDRYKLLVKDKYFRRELIRCGNEISEIGYDQITESEEIQQLAEQKFFELLQQDRKHHELEHISVSLAEMINRLDGQEPVAIETGVLDLDVKITGLFPKHLYIVAARPSMGKTWFGLNIARSIADRGKKVAFVSAESSKAELNNRLVAMRSGVNSSKIQKNDLTPDERLKVVEAIAGLCETDIFINDDSAKDITPNLIRSMLRKLAIKGMKPDVVIVDYLQKLGSRSAVNRAQVVGEISGDFKDIAKEFDIPVVCLAQINRGVETRQDKRPVMSDLKDSGDIEQDADVIMTLYRDQYYNPDGSDKGILEINIAKNRNGEVGICRCLFESATGQIKNLKEFIQGEGC
jgi:replicative DNA helicase